MARTRRVIATVTIQAIDLGLTPDLVVELGPLEAIMEVRADLEFRAANFTTTIIRLQIGDLEIRHQELVLALYDQVELLEVEKDQTSHLL